VTLYERAGAIFLEALELEADQPLVLNYLGYSWVEMGLNLDRAQAMIARLGIRPRTRLVGSDYLALIRSFVRQGIFARYRVAYWRFLGKTFIRRPRHIGLAITLAIMGHHFFILSRRMESEPLK